MSEFMEYVAKPVKVRAKRLAQAHTINNGRGQLLKGEPGEFLVDRGNGRMEFLSGKQFEAEFQTPDASAVEKLKESSSKALEKLEKAHAVGQALEKLEVGSPEVQTGGPKVTQGPRLKK